MKSINIRWYDMTYEEQWSWETVLLLHWIPVHKWIWKKVAENVSQHAHTVCVDLAGYWHSPIPKNFDMSLSGQYQYLHDFIREKNLKNITLVVNDLWSLYGLKYAVENPENIKRIVLLESLFMPMEQWYKQLPLFMKMMFFMMRSKFLAYFMIVQVNILTFMMMYIAVAKQLPYSEIKNYSQVYTDKEKRKIIFYWPGPATMPALWISKHPWDFADEWNKIASGLIKINSKIPFLLFQWHPGMINQQASIEYAKKNFKNLTVFDAWKAKHFIQLDQSEKVSDAIIHFLRTK